MTQSENNRGEGGGGRCINNNKKEYFNSKRQTSIQRLANQLHHPIRQLRNVSVNCLWGVMLTKNFQNVDPTPLIPKP